MLKYVVPKSIYRNKMQCTQPYIVFVSFTHTRKDSRHFTRELEAVLCKLFFSVCEIGLSTEDKKDNGEIGVLAILHISL